MVRDRLPARHDLGLCYPEKMDKQEHLHRHLELCKRIYERMKRDGTWPWATDSDSQKSDHMVESEHKTNET